MGPLIMTTERPYYRMTLERDRDLRIVYNHVRQTEPELTTDEALEKTVRHIAPGYYTDYDYAVHMVPRVIRERKRFCNSLRLQKWLEIAERAEDYVASGRDGNLSSAIARVLGDGRASRFFITAATARRILIYGQIPAYYSNNGFEPPRMGEASHHRLLI